MGRDSMTMEFESLSVVNHKISPCIRCSIAGYICKVPWNKFL